MKALTFHGKSDIRRESVPDPKIEYPRDAIIRSPPARPAVRFGYFDASFLSAQWRRAGHETMGEVVEVGSGPKLNVADRVSRCLHDLPVKDSSVSAAMFPPHHQPRPAQAEKLWGHSPAGCSATRISWAVTPAAERILRVPHADVGPIKVPLSASAHQVLFLRTFSRRCYMAAEFATLSPVTSSRSGGAARSGNLPSAARSCLAPNASSRSTRCLSGSASPKRPGRRRSTIVRLMFTRRSRACRGRPVGRGQAVRLAAQAAA